MRSTRFGILFISLLVVAAIGASLFPQAAWGQPSSADPSYRIDMINGDFEEISTRSSLSSWVANGWEPWFWPGGATFNREPEFGVLYNRQALETGINQFTNGVAAQRWFTTWGTHDCGIFQRVFVPENSTVTFSIWMIAWSANNNDVYGYSDSAYSKWVGIDPYGGNNPIVPGVGLTSRIVWSEVNTVMDKWVQLKVTAKVVGNVATVYTRGQAAFPVKHNTCIIDEALLYSDKPAQPSAPPVVTTPVQGGMPGTAGESVFFPQTGKSSSGEWLAWVKANGGIDNTGLPKSNVIQDPILGWTSQYYQRVVLDYFPNNPPAYRVQRRLLGTAYDPNIDPPLALPPANSANYAFFPATTDPAKLTGMGHGVSNYSAGGAFTGFKDYFDSHGGVTSFGYPQNDGKMVGGFWTQTFQAAVFQYHPENDREGMVPGTSIPYRTYLTQLLLLGDWYVGQKGIALP